MEDMEGAVAWHFSWNSGGHITISWSQNLQEWVCHGALMCAPCSSNSLTVEKGLIHLVHYMPAEGNLHRGELELV